jgi:hypothetical protein
MRKFTRFVDAKSVAAMVGVLGAATAARASLIITPITSGDVPISNPASIFDVSNSGNTYSLGTSTNLNPQGFDVRDLFGGSFGTYGYEHNDVLFQDNQPIGTIDTVNVALTSPISLGSFSLFLEDDGTNGNRSASEFLLYADGTLVDDVNILDASGSESYTSVYGSNYIEIDDSFTGLPAASDYTLEFVQNQDANGASGIRALDFQGQAAVGGSTAGTAVPEPASMLGLTIGVLTLLGRPRRVLAK